jgi:hypothetical protein
MLLTLLLAGCVPSDCGYDSYWVGGDSYVQLQQECSSIGGSFGFHFANAPVSTILFEGTTGDVGSDVGLILDLTPATRLFFRTDHLEVGTRLDMTQLAGTGLHDPSASGALPVEAPLVYGVVEVLAGPRTRDGNDEYRLSWNLTYGELAEPHAQGFQRHVGETWIDFGISPTSWNPGEAGQVAPPDLEP